MIIPLLALLGLLVLFILFDGLRNKVLFKIGVRNIFRRKANTVIVILGLMVATAIISSSLGVGDTMDTMVEDEIYGEWQQTDVTLFNTTAEGELVPIPYRTYGHLKRGIFEGVENVNGVSGEVHGNLPIFNPSNNLVRPNALFIGMDFNESDGFNPFYMDGEVLENPELGEGEIFIDNRLSNELDANKGDELWLINPETADIKNYTVKNIIDNDGRAAFGGASKIIMSLSDAQAALSIPDQINYVRVTSIGDVAEGIEYSDQIFHDIDTLVIQVNPAYRDLEVRGNKNQVLQEYSEDMSLFTDLFFIFGTFSIVAGVILAINIFVMLGEERKSEMGMARAIGMKRYALQRTFSYEGLIYAIAASLVGIFVGIAVTYMIFYLLGGVFADVGGGSTSLLVYFTVEIESMLLAFGAGFLLTMGTIFFSVRRISNLNIVRAIRDIPEPPVSKTSSKILYLAVVTLLLGGLSTMLGMRIELLAPALAGTSLIIIGLGMIVRRWMGDRAAFTGVGIFLLLWWLLPIQQYGIFVGYTGGLPIFILSGLFIVTAGVLIVMLNGEIITNSIEKMFSSKKGFKAVVVSAISHPIKEKFRTGMTIFIFALIIFAITVMGMIVGIFDTNMALIIEEQSGGYEIIGMTMGVSIDNIHEMIQNDTLTPGVSTDDFSHIDTAYSDTVDMEASADSSMVVGIDQNFVDNSTFGITSYLDEFGSSREMWEAVLAHNSSYVITNAPSVESGPMAGGRAELGVDDGVGTSTEDELELGSTITLINGDGEEIEKIVAGFMEQNLIQGFFMSKENTERQFGITSTNIFFFNVRDGLDADEIGRALNQEFFEYGLQTIVVDTMIKDALNAVFMFFDLFSGYMGLGLVIGIAGLGIISLRAAHERRMEIGIMRAVGFERNMIRYSFLIENSFITIIGILLGSTFGIAIGWLLWDGMFRPMGWEFTIPWSSIITIAVIAYCAMLLTAIPSANKASKVSPAEALRFD
ncbi:MAG: FtsX-like permease family protein [Thermoplasmata archaeon]